MEIDIKGWFMFAYLDDVLLMLERHHSNGKWGYITSNSKIATSLGFNPKRSLEKISSKM